jgi:Thrombospondin C-terminal region.
MSDSGYIYDISYTGGRVGLYTFGQGNVVWSNLGIQCEERFVNIRYIYLPFYIIILL